jgi:hypothetical protein
MEGDLMPVAPTMPCPDCGQEVVRAEFRDDEAFVEAAEGGSLRLGVAVLDLRPPPALQASLSADPHRQDDRYRRHRCSRRVEVRELATIHSAYAEDDKRPEIAVDAKQLAGDVRIGDRLTVHDGNGAEVRVEVRRLVAMAVPDWTTYSTRLEREQTTLGSA